MRDDLGKTLDDAAGAGWSLMAIVLAILGVAAVVALVLAIIKSTSWLVIAVPVGAFLLLAAWGAWIDRPSRGGKLWKG